MDIHRNEIIERFGEGNTELTRKENRLNEQFRAN